MAFRALYRKLTVTHEKFIFLFPGAFRLLKLSWKISAPPTDLGFIKVLLTIQTSNRSQAAIFVEGSINIRVRLTVLYPM
jgi:hypothetical protein